MPDSSGEENDSRTASVGLQRTHVNGNNSDSHRNKRQKRSRGNAANNDVRDFVPQGGTFSVKPLEVDPDSTSSSGSDSANDNGDAAPNNPYAGTTAQAVNWNQGNKRTIRTTLGGRKANTNNKKPEPEPEQKQEPEESKSDAQFEAVNGAYWRSRSESVSTENGEAGNQKDGAQDMEEGEVHGDTTEAPALDSSGDSDDSESLDSNADDSILLNLGQEQNGQAATDDDEYDPETQPIMGQSIANGTSKTQNGIAPDSSKDEAIRNFTQRYPSPPAVMVNLVGEDKDIQSRFMYWAQGTDLQTPICCTECMQEGHIAQVCPSKEVCCISISIGISTDKLVHALRRLEQTRQQLLPYMAKMPTMSRARPRRTPMLFITEKLRLRSSL